MIWQFYESAGGKSQQKQAQIWAVVCIAITPILLILFARKPVSTVEVMGVFGFFYTLGVVFILDIAYRNKWWSFRKEIYLLSRSTLAIVRRGECVRFLKPKDIRDIDLERQTLFLSDNTKLSLRGIRSSQGQELLIYVLLETWFENPGSTRYSLLQ